MTLPNSANTNRVIVGAPEGPEVRVQFPWLDDHGKPEIKTGVWVGGQVTQAVVTKEEEPDEVIATNYQQVVDVPGDSRYLIGPNGVMREATPQAV